jgi:hypothetical protein
MAKVTITIEDTINDDVSINAFFDPPLVDDQEPTSAQCVALSMIYSTEDEEVEDTELCTDAEEALLFGADAALGEEDLG